MRYRQGVDAYNVGNFHVAVDYFLEADQLAPNAALSFNIARAYEKMNDVAAALRWYRDYLRRAPEAPDRVAVDGTIHALESRLQQQGVQQLTILSEPEGATLKVDGSAVGVTPWTSELAPGAHAVELTLEGYAPEARTVEVAPEHAQDLTIVLGAAPVGAAATPAPASPPEVASAPTTPPSRGVDMPRPARNDLTLTTIGWAGIGAGGAALGGALVFELLRQSAEADTRKQKTQVAYADSLDTMESRQTTARVLAGVGGALVVTGGVFLYFGMRKSHAAAPSVAASCSARGCWSVLRGAF
jgi:tetratricopeptide (TPR) repeat protein